MQDPTVDPHSYADGEFMTQLKALIQEDAEDLNGSGTSAHGPIQEVYILRGF